MIFDQVAHLERKSGPQSPRSSPNFKTAIGGTLACSLETVIAKEERLNRHNRFFCCS